LRLGSPFAFEDDSEDRFVVPLALNQVKRMVEWINLFQTIMHRYYYVVYGRWSRLECGDLVSVRV
jgi:hypothetical protein